MKGRSGSAADPAVHADHASFLTRFDELRRSVVRPVFEAAGEVLRALGHGVRISEEAFAIALHLAPGGSLSFSMRHWDKTICISNGGEAALPLEELETQRVEEEGLKLMAAMVPRAPAGSTRRRPPAGRPGRKYGCCRGGTR